MREDKPRPVPSSNPAQMRDERHIRPVRISAHFHETTHVLPKHLHGDAPLHPPWPPGVYRWDLAFQVASNRRRRMKRISIGRHKRRNETVGASWHPSEKVAHND